MLIKFIAQEVQAIYQKYGHVTKGEADLVTSFIKQIEDEGVGFDPFQAYKTTQALAKALESEENIDVIKLYILLTLDFHLGFQLDDIRGLYEELKAKGYIQVDKYLLYHDYGEAQIEAVVEARLAEELEDDVDLVIESFDPEEIVEMWLAQTDFSEAARYFIENNGWKEALGIEDLGEAFEDRYKNTISCCRNEGVEIHA